MQFFILGNPRSGTSMFRLMLNAHSKITIPPESGFTHWLASKYKDVKFTQKIYNQFVIDLFASKKFETFGLHQVDVLSLISKKQPQTYENLIELVYRSYALKQNKDSLIYGDKNNYYINHISELLDIFPSSKLVFIIRDGRDVAVSYKKINESVINSLYKPMLPTNIQDMAKEWIKNAESLKYYVNSDTECHSIFIKYEDLIENPKNTITKVLNFLGLKYEEQILEFYNHNDEPDDFLQWKGKTTEKIDSSNTKKYKLELTKEEIDEYNSIASNTLEFFGY